MGNNTGDTKLCSNGAIVAQSVRVEDDYYTSQLSITIAYSIPLGSILNITCNRDNGVAEVTVQNYTITVGKNEYSSIILCGISDADMSATEEMTVNKGSTTLAVFVGVGITVVAVVVLISAVIIGFVVIRKKRVAPRILNSCSVQRFTKEHMETQTEPYSHLCFDQSLCIANVAYNRCQNVQDPNQHSVMTMTGNSNSPLKCFRQGLQSAESLDLDSLLVKVRRKLDTKQWYIFGTEIGVPTDFLEKLKDYPDSECLIEVADHWLRNHPDKPTWSEIEHIVTKLAQITGTNTR